MSKVGARGRTRRTAADFSSWAAGCACSGCRGYTGLMERAEEETHQRLMQINRRVVQVTLAQHNGTLVKHTASLARRGGDRG